MSTIDALVRSPNFFTRVEDDHIVSELLPLTAPPSKKMRDSKKKAIMHDLDSQNRLRALEQKIRAALLLYSNDDDNTLVYEAEDVEILNHLSSEKGLPYDFKYSDETRRFKVMKNGSRFGAYSIVGDTRSYSRNEATVPFFSLVSRSNQPLYKEIRNGFEVFENVMGKTTCGLIFANFSAICKPKQSLIRKKDYAKHAKNCAKHNLEYEPIQFGFSEKDLPSPFKELRNKYGSRLILIDTYSQSGALKYISDEITKKIVLN